MTDCKNFVASGLPLLAGHLGYIGECGADCQPNYTQIARCNATYDSCQDVCGVDMKSCLYFASDSRPVCKRNYQNFAPVRNGDLRTKCCIYAQGDSTLQTNDCPPTAYGGSAVCTGIINSECLRDINSVIGPGCEALASDSNPIVKNGYNALMQQRCTATTIDNLNEGNCLTWCKNNRNVCTNSVISGFCQDKMGQEQYDNLCACFYPESVYQNIRDKLSTQFSVPVDLFSGGRQCYLPICSNASIQYNQDAKCRDLNLVKCVNEVDIANNGTIGTVTINQDAQCQQFIKNPTCNPATCGGYQCNTQTDTCFTTCSSEAQCGANYSCNNGRCELKNVQCSDDLCGGYRCNSDRSGCLASCTADSQCNLGYSCQNGRCLATSTPSDQSFWQRYKWWIIGAIILVVLIIVGIIIGVVVNSNRKKKMMINYGPPVIT